MDSHTLKIFRSRALLIIALGMTCSMMACRRGAIRDLEQPKQDLRETQMVRSNERVCTTSRHRILAGGVHNAVDQLPEFPGGSQSFDKFVRKYLRYPKEAAGLRGRVIVTFIVEPDGSLTNIKTVGPVLHEALNKEAVRLMSLSPKWIPGKEKAQAVRVQYTVPILFGEAGK
jgi:TonB family protein